MENLEPKPISELRPKNYDQAVDLRGTPTHVCICGSFVWNVKTVFENYEPVEYFRDMECANCGSLASAPFPSDMPEDYIPTDHYLADDEE